MSAIYLKTFDDILDACMEEMKLQSSDAVNRARLERLVNEAYMDIVVPEAQWTWLRGQATLRLDSAFATGTATLTNGSATVTLTTAPGLTRARHYFSVVGEAEVYRIATHTAASTTVVLDTPYLGTTGSGKSFKIWTDALALPVEARESFEVTQDNQSEPLEGVGLQEFRRYVAASPKAEGRPTIYSTSDFIDPAPYAAISGLPALTSRASSGFLKTLVFASTVAAHLEAGDRIQVTGATDASYNGEFIVASVSTTTVQYVGTSALSETAAVDATLTVRLADNESSTERYRELLVHPSLHTLKSILKVDYIKDVSPLEDDADEPLMPIGDRAILKYGALMFAWSSIMKDTEQQQRNERMFYAKLAKMKGSIGDSTDRPRFAPSKTYLARKRRRPTGSSMRAVPSFSGGSSATTQPTDIVNDPNTVAVFGADGVLDASQTISTTELGYLNNVTSNIQTQLDAKQTAIDAINTLADGKIYLGNGSNVATEVTPTGDVTISNAGVTAITGGVIVDSDVNAAAAIARSKIASGTVDHVVINSGAGALSSEAQLAITRGGTGQATAAAAFNALSPLTTTGDTLYASGTNTAARLAAGSNGQVLQQVAGIPSWQTIAQQNLLLNGNFPNWQRGTSTTVANGISAYLADRWYAKNSLGTNGVLTFSRVAGVSDGAAFGAKVQITTAPTAAQANGCELYQTLDNATSLQLYNKSASFQVKVKSFSNVTQVGIQFFYKTTEAKVDTAIGAEVTATVNTSTFTTMNISSQALGTSQTAAGVVGVRIRVTGVSSGNTYDINNGFVVEQAIVAAAPAIAAFTPAYPTAAAELAACQRFYETSYSQGTAPAATTTTGLTFTGPNSTGGALNIAGSAQFATEKRAATSLAYWDGAGNASKYSSFTTGGMVQTNNVGAIAGSTVGTRGFWFYIALGANLTGAIHWAADAEI